jgi:hypothetical protein
MSLLLPPLAEAAEEPLRKSLSELASDLAMGRLSSRELVSLCLGQVEKLDHQIKAWVMVDQAGALAAADETDERRSKGRPRSELDGIPFGVKDIIDVAGWPTVAGFEPWKNKIARTDAAIVAQMRSLGMIPLGKTVTTQFASIDPPATQNPWNFAHTPGGSSSGSCAGFRLANGRVDQSPSQLLRRCRPENGLRRMAGSRCRALFAKPRYTRANSHKSLGSAASAGKYDWAV